MWRGRAEAGLLPGGNNGLIGKKSHDRINAAGNHGTCTYAFHWRGTVEGHPTQGHGRGTTVLRRDPARWLIVHEHLSRASG